MKKQDPPDGPGELTQEQRLVTETLQSLLGVKFEVIRTPVEFPAPSRDMEWLMRCRRRDEIERAPFLNTIWRQKGGFLWLESLVLGDTVEWIENAYDEEAAASSIDIDYARLDEEGFRSEFGSRFPLVLERIRSYQEIAGRFSSGPGSGLQIRRSGSKGILVFTLAARLDSAEVEGRSGAEALKAAVDAMKGAYSEIMQV
jgi:hypothetical protein